VVRDLLKSVRTVIDKVIPDADKREELKGEVSELLLDAESKYHEQAVKLQLASSGVRWIDGMKHLIRPVITLLMVLRMVSAWLGAPPLDAQEWMLLQIAVGFYFLSRGAEKIVKKIV